MTVSDDVARLTVAARALDISSREKRWTHLSLCVLDAVHSMDAHYDRVTVPLCHRYAKRAELADPVLPVAEAHVVVGTSREQPLWEFADWARALGEEALADALGSRHRAYRRRFAPYKSRVDIDYAAILVRHGIGDLSSAACLLADDERRKVVEVDLARVPGHGSGARRDYLWMLVGDGDRIKPDRMVLRWIARNAQVVDVPRARVLLTETARELGCTPWELDHAVWRAQSGRAIPREAA